jgi:plastocyanin
MAIRPVNIVGSNPATFEAVLPPKPPVGTVYVDAGDVVFWHNATDETHQISLLQNTPNQGVVTPEHQTDAFQVPPPPKGTTRETTIAYTCLVHQLEKGLIKVSKPNP